MKKSSLETWKTYIYIIGALMAIGGTFFKTSISYARLEDRVLDTRSDVDEHGKRIDTVERCITEQSVMLKYIGEDLKDSKQTQSRILDILEGLKND